MKTPERRKYIATSIRRHSDEIENVFYLSNINLSVGDSFKFDGLEWIIDEVLELEYR